MLTLKKKINKNTTTEAKHTKRLLLIGWDAYPHIASGGVHKWQKSLIEGLPDWEFVVFNQISNPNANGGFKLPKNVKAIGIPIFSTSRYEEYHDDGRSLVLKISKTTQKTIDKFLPLYDRLLAEFFSEVCNLENLREAVYEIHSFFEKYDYKKCLENPKSWETFMERIKRDPIYKEMNLNDALRAFQFIQRSLQILSVRIPQVDLVQCSLAYFPALLGMIAKQKWGCPVVVSEHGVAFREATLNYNLDYYDKYSRILVKTVAANVVRVLHHMADVVVAASRANTFWQQMLGVPTTKMKLIYNGIDTERFIPIEIKREDKSPTLVSVGRLEPFKDIVCLLQAIKFVKEYEPNIKCLVYGESITLDYANRCAKMWKQLQLEDTVKFMGVTNEPEKVFNSADIVVISSVTEGLPLTACEAMSCGRPIVAADVGGTREAVQGCGMLVKSRNPYAMSEAIITLLKDEKLRKEYGKAGMIKSRAEFSVTKMVNEYAILYESLLNRTNQKSIQSHGPDVGQDSILQQVGRE
ncbi:MAG: GT4 family glycosyltransferase PelF [Thaumarchaeota archaeon]|nr:GT4 family glycosyltransferase PelF [Nitrososphaerota archaeon]